MIKHRYFEAFSSTSLLLSDNTAHDRLGSGTKSTWLEFGRQFYLFLLPQRQLEISRLPIKKYPSFSTRIRLEMSWGLFKDATNTTWDVSTSCQKYCFFVTTKVETFMVPCPKCPVDPPLKCWHTVLNCGHWLATCMERSELNSQTFWWVQTRLVDSEDF